MKPLESATETRPSVDQVSEATIPQSRAAASPLASRVALRFQDRELERAYLQGEFERNRRWILGSVVLVFIMALLFYPLDRRFIPAAALDHVHAARVFLLAAAPLLGFIGLLVIRRAAIAIPYLFACTLFAALGWTLIRAVSGPSAEPYIAFGVAQTALFIYACMGLPFRWSAPAVALTLLPIIALSTGRGLDSNDFWYTTASLVTVALIASFGALRHETERERSEWLSLIAGFTRHELKNAMAGVGSSLQLLERLGLPAAGSEYVERARRSLQFMRNILTRVGAAPSPEEGNLGLGLYVAQTIARSHGGSIRAEPTSDRPGATFVVDLPLLWR